MDFLIIENESTGQKTATAFFMDKDEPLVQATADNPNWDKIVAGLQAHDPKVYDLFNPEKVVNEKFEALSTHYSVRNGVLHRDLDPVDDSISNQVIAFLDAGVDDWKPLIKFMDRVAANPNPDSRAELYDWLRAAKLTITDDGMVVGYKCVRKAEDGFTSTHPGPAVVDGVPHESGYVPNKVGSVVEMARSVVDNDRRRECSVGLHVGTFEYATWLKRQGYDSRVIGEVHFDPADAVAVPRDHNAQKVRVCRYKFVGLVDSPYTGPIRPVEDYRSVEEIPDDPEAPDNF